MAFRTYFVSCSFTLVLTGFLALFLTGRLDPISSLLYLGALGAAWYVEQKRPESRITSRTAIFLSTLSIPLCAIDIFLFGSNPFIALARFALFLSAIKLFQVKKDSDWGWLYSLTFCEVLLSASLTIDITFLLSLGLFGFFFLATLSAFEIERSHRDIKRLEEETFAIRRDRPRSLRRSAFLSSVSGVQLLMIGVVAVPIFLLMPRFGGGALGSTLSPTETLTGFAEVVRIGEIERIRQNSTVVMYVQLNRPADRTYRWRGIALDTYNPTSNTWSTAQEWKYVSINRRPGAPAIATIEPPESEQQYQNLLSQTFYVEPISVRSLFAARTVKVIDNAPGAIAVDQNGSLRGPESGKRVTYTALSDVSIPSPQELLADTSTAYPQAIAEVALEMPPVDERVAELARTIVGDATAPLEKARRIEAHLRTQYTYTLDLDRTDTSIDPISDFLLNTRRGHCEYFASSMVILMRSVGVPARLVNGFQMGELNAINGTYTVRQSDAHSWVEIYLAGSGRWVEFDPTPSSGLSNYPTGFAAQLRQSFEAIHMMWIQYVVTLDSSEQVSMMRSMQRGLVEAKAWITSTFRSWRASVVNFLTGSARLGSRMTGGLFVFVGVVVALGIMTMALMLLQNRGWSFAGFVLPTWRWRRRFGRRSERPEESAVRFYEQMLSMLSQYGIARERHETPREFAETCGIAEVAVLTDLYHRVRFGGDLTAEVDREVDGALTGLAAGLRSKRK